MEPIFTIDHHYTKKELNSIKEIGANHFRVNPARIGLDKGIQVSHDIMEIIPKAVIYIDTVGAKTRVKLKQNSKFLYNQIKLGTGENADLQISHNLFENISVGDVLIIRCADGNKEIEITKINSNMLIGRTDETSIRNNAHIYIKNKYIPNTELQEIDKQILNEFTQAGGIGLSFVDCPELVEQAMIYTKVDVYAKIESPIGVDKAKNIIDKSAGIIIARDDLSCFYNSNQLDIIMKQLIDLCCRYGKTFIPASNLFLDLCKREDISEENMLRLKYLKDVGTKYVYCNESVIRKDIYMIRKIYNLCKLDFI